MRRHSLLVDFGNFLDSLQTTVHYEKNISFCRLSSLPYPTSFVSDMSPTKKVRFVDEIGHGDQGFSRRHLIHPERDHPAGPRRPPLTPRRFKHSRLVVPASRGPTSRLAGPRDIPPPPPPHRIPLPTARSRRRSFSMSDTDNYSSLKKTLNVDSPSFTPATLSVPSKTATIPSQAANAAPFTPRNLASGK